MMDSGIGYDPPNDTAESTLKRMNDFCFQWQRGVLEPCFDRILVWVDLLITVRNR